jgi:hypothetical protein
MIRFMMCPDHLSGGQVGSAFDGGSGFTIVSGQGRNGRPAFSTGGGNDAASKLCATNGTSWGETTYFAAHASVINTDGRHFTFLDGATRQVDVNISSSGQLSFWRAEAGFGTLLAQTSVGAVPVSPAYPHIAVKVTVHPSLGEVACQVNGVAVNLYTGGGTLLGTTATGLNTRASGATQITAVSWRNSGYLCDLMLWDTTGSVNNTWLGDKAVLYSPVTGAGAVNDTTIAGSSPAATRWQGVAEVPATDDVSYNSYSTGNKQLYAWGGIPTTRRGVVALAPVNRWRKDDAGSNIMRSLLRTSAGVDREGEDQSLTTAYGDYLGKIEEVNPVTSAAWQPGDAPQIGGVRNT